MAHDESAPVPQLPELGFYYHYKHDSAGAINEYAYEVIALARHTEDGSLLILYRPLYVSEWMPPAQYNARPLSMFMEDVTKDGKTCPRFTHITDQAVITELARIRKNMYGV